MYGWIRLETEKKKNLRMEGVLFCTYSAFCEHEQAFELNNVPENEPYVAGSTIYLEPARYIEIQQQAPILGVGQLPDL